MRRAPLCHRIKLNHKSTGYPKMMCFVDTETVHRKIDEETISNDLQFGVMEFWRRLPSGEYEPCRKTDYTFHTWAEFYTIIEEAVTDKATLWIFAHNMDFDYQVLAANQEMQDRGWEVNRMILESPPFLVSYRRERKRIKFVDGMNWFRVSLASLAQPLGMKKMEDPGISASWEERHPYCKNDVAILRSAVLAWIDFCENSDMGTFAISQAGQALNAFRHRFMKQEIYVDHTEKVAKLEREGYVGARTEMFFQGSATDVAHLDVNSLYPSVMRGGLYPTRMIAPRAHADLAVVEEAIRDGVGVVAEVRLVTPERWYPVRGERITFPVGEFWTVLCTPELKRAFEHGHVKEVKRAQFYQMEEIFTEFIDYFYNMRLHYKAIGNDAFQYICKIFMNSLYGKFGQLTPDWQPSEDARAYEVVPENTTGFDIIEEGVKRTFRKVGGYLEEKVGRVESENSFCAIAAHVTSYARMALLEGIETAGWDNVLYVDTDSIFCTQEGKRRMAHLIDPSKLGAWKDEGDVRSMLIYGAKDYVIDGEPRRKGVRVSARELSPGVFEQEMFVSFTGSIRSGHPNEQRVLTIRKRLSRDYRKGIVTDSGRVLPLVLDVTAVGGVP